MLILRGHTGPVRCLAYSPDGRMLASGSDDKTIKIWELCNGRERRTLQGHKDGVRAVAFAPDGKLIISGSWDDVINSWSADTTQMRFRYRRCSSPRILGGGVWSLAFAPDGLSFAVGCTNGSIHRFWTRDPLQECSVFKEHAWPVNALAYSPDGLRLASGSHDRTVLIWDAEWGRRQDLLAWHDDWVRCLVFSPDGLAVASAGDDATIKITSTIKLANLSHHREVAALRGHTSAIRQLVFASDGRTLFSASWDETVRIWDVTTGCQRAAYNWQIGRVHCLALAPDGMTAAVGGHDRSIVIWDVE